MYANNALLMLASLKYSNITTSSPAMFTEQELYIMLAIAKCLTNCSALILVATNFS